ncbi:MAG: hypothetical protein ACC645_13595 [Pirellulales bacterium]
MIQQRLGQQREIQRNIRSLDVASPIAGRITDATGLDAARGDSLRHGMTGIVLFKRSHPSLASHLYRRTLHFLNRLRLAG